MLTAFVSLIGLGTGLLALPLATDTGIGLAIEDAAFLSTSATTVTGLATFDLTKLSLFGEVVVLLLIQIGGFGIMTIGSVLAVLTFGRISVHQRLTARAEIGEVGYGDLMKLLGAIARITLVVEATLALVLGLRFWLGYDHDVHHAAALGVFHAVSTFNNAGISLFRDGFVQFATDPVIVLAITAGFCIGGLGFPVLLEAQRRLGRRDAQPRLGRQRGGHAHLSLHARLVLIATVVLTVIGPLAVLVLEWGRAATLGNLGITDKVLVAWFQGLTPRTAGFNTVDIGALGGPTLLVLILLMFIGAAPASTGGGVKVTTIAVPLAVLWSQLHGRSDVTMLGRRLPQRVIGVTLSVFTLSAMLVGSATIVLMLLDDLDLQSALFESTSAFGTVGLSTGVTGSIGAVGHVVLMLVMVAGRIGPLTFATALALRTTDRRYRFPEEGLIVG